MSETQSLILFWTSMVIAQAGAFVIFKDLADISQWVVQSTREFTMKIWYNRKLIGAVSITAMIIAVITWARQPEILHGAILGVLIFVFVLNFVSGMFNPKWMFRSQQHRAKFVSVDEAPKYFERSLDKAHFGPEKYASVDDIEVLVLETDRGAYAYSDYYLLQPHVVKGDTIEGEEVIMTYCGLTNLGIAYSPVIGDHKLDHVDPQRKTRVPSRNGQVRNADRLSPSRRRGITRAEKFTIFDPLVTQRVSVKVRHFSGEKDRIRVDLQKLIRGSRLRFGGRVRDRQLHQGSTGAVSYTHLTLPTKRIV